MYETINEKIAVLATFGRGFQDVTPLSIRWNGRRLPITKIGYRHKVKEGRKIIHVFSVTDGQTFFELRFDAEELAWVLGRVSDGQGA